MSSTETSSGSLFNSDSTSCLTVLMALLLKIIPCWQSGDYAIANSELRRDALVRPAERSSAPARSHSNSLDGAKPRPHTRLPCHRDHRDPLPILLFAIGNRSAKTLGNLLGQ